MRALWRAILGGRVSWPQSPPANEQQLALVFSGSQEARYREWRASPDGRRVFEAIVDEAIRLAHEGARRLSAKQLVEWARQRYRVQINNDFTPLVARELATKVPDVANLIEMRIRKAS